MVNRTDFMDWVDRGQGWKMRTRWSGREREGWIEIWNGIEISRIELFNYFNGMNLLLSRLMKYLLSNSVNLPSVLWVLWLGIIPKLYYSLNNPFRLISLVLSCNILFPLPWLPVSVLWFPSLSLHLLFFVKLIL